MDKVAGALESRAVEGGPRSLRPTSWSSRGLGSGHDGPPARPLAGRRARHGLLGSDGAVAATIFAEMTALAQRTGAINLGQGFPDVDGPLAVKHAAVRAIEDGHNQYPPGPGILALRNAVASHQFRHYGLDPDPETEVLVTTGATEALAATILALAGPGDDVVTLEPFYDSHAACIALAGARHVTVPCSPGPTGSGSTWTRCARPSPTARA